MADEKHVFISYASKDNLFVGRLREDLGRQKDLPYWIDKEGLRPGTPNWEKGIRAALKQAFAVIYVVTPNSYSSDNVQGEIAIAELESCPIYPVWADGDKWHECVPIDKVKTQYIDMKGDKYEANRELLFNALRGKRPELAVPPTVPVVLAAGAEPRNPYKGLNAFTDKDVADFFGRNELINQLVEAVKGRMEVSQDRLLTVIGASGSGKSSVVMAGLLPKLQSGALSGSDQWTYLKPMVPGDHPVQALYRILIDTPELNAPMELIESDLQHPSGMGLYRLARKIPKQPVVLYVDQFEELFMTGVPEDERQQFINLLIVAATQTDSPVLVLLTLRADFYDRPMNYPELGRLVQAYNRSVLPMSIADLRDTVEKPAAAAGLTFESGLVADIIFDLRDDKNAQAGALPLLQYTLEQLYDRRTDRTLTAASYIEIGGVRGAIGAHAERVFLTLDIEAQNSFARVFQLLVHVDERGTPTRKRETQAVLKNNEPASRLVDALINRARVLRVDAEKHGDTPYIEVAHEALLTSWQRLSDWIKSADNDLRLIQEMKSAAARWATEGYPKHRLWSHELLQPIYYALESLPQNLTNDEQAFIQPEAERLLEDFKTAPDHVQLTIVQRDFTRIGETAVPLLIQAYGYNRDDTAFEEIIRLLSVFPDRTVSCIQKALMDENEEVLQGAIDLIMAFGLISLTPNLLNFTNHSDSVVSNMAVLALGELSDERSATTLLDILKNKNADKRVRQSAAQALGNLKDSRILSALLEALEDKNSEIRAAAASALENQKDESVLPNLLEALKDEADVVRASAVRSLGAFEDKRLIPILITTLNDSNAEVRKDTINALAAIGGEDQNVIDGLLNALSDSNAEVRKNAINALAAIGGEDQNVIDGLLNALSDYNAEVRAVAARELSKVYDVTLEHRLLAELWDENWIVQIAIANTLRKIGTPKIVPEMMEALKSADWQMRWVGVRVLGKVGNASLLPEIIRITADQNDSVRSAAIETLGEIGNKSVIPQLLKALEDFFVLDKAIEALGLLGDESFVPALLNALNDHDQRSEVRIEAVRAMARIGNEKVIPALLNTLNDRDSDLRALVATSLAQLGCVENFHVFVNLLTDIDEKVRITASRILIDNHLFESIPFIAELLYHPFGTIQYMAHYTLEQMDIPESRAALAEYDAQHKG